MARASVLTKLPLDTFAKIIGFHPLHFNQIDIAGSLPTCNVPVLQYNWQSADRTSREDIAEAILMAEEMMEVYLGYPLAPTWIVAEPHKAQRNPLLLLDHKQVVIGGIEAKSLIEAGTAIVYSDEDNDGYDETATVVVNTTVTEVGEIAVYYPDKDGDSAWEIRPLRSVVIAAGVATIVFNRHQALLSDLMENMLSPSAQDGMNDDNFLEEVDVYRHYNDPQQQFRYVGPIACACGGSESESCTCALQSWEGCFSVLDHRQSLIDHHAGTWNATNSGFDSSIMCGMHDRLQVWYKAGLPMSQLMQRAIAYYAVSLLDRPLCACNGVQEISNRWREDLARSVSTPSSSTSWRIGRRVYDNPFGSTRGAVFAWNAVQQNMIGAAVRHA